MLNGRKPAIDDVMSKRLLTAPSVPTTSIFSRSDGVVAWRPAAQMQLSAPPEEQRRRNSIGRQQLKAAVKEVGSNAKDVEAHLKQGKRG